MWMRDPPPIVKLADAQHHAQLLATFFIFMNNPLVHSYMLNETTCDIIEAQ